jgi:hypothetical protein
MDINLETIKRIISSDELCDKVNSTNYKDLYIKQIQAYVLSLCDSIESINVNFSYINRYLRKFACNKSVKEDIFFDNVLLKVYSFSTRNEDFKSILDSFNFDGIKELLAQRYNQIILSNSFINITELRKMFSFYCYACPNYIMPSEYINYFTYHFVSKSVVLDYDLICYYYKMFGLSFSTSKGLNVSFVVSSQLPSDEPYYEGNNKLIIYKQNISDKVDYKILSDLFGYSDEETRQLTYKAIEMAQNNSDYLHSLECGYTISVPNLTKIDEMVVNNIKELIKDKQKNINNE